MSGNLLGLHVLECARGISGPFCGKLLADLGAEVLKVEPPEIGDPARHWEPFVGDIPGPDRSGLFLYLNTSKMSVSLDPGKPSGAAILRRLTAAADVLIEDFRPGELAGWGLAPAELIGENARLVVVSLTPFGQTGPHAAYDASDMVASHAGGLAFFTPTDLQGQRDPPLRAGGRQASFLTGVTAGIATMGALHARERTGRGGHVDLSQHEALAYTVCREMARISYAGIHSRRGYPMIAGIAGLLRCSNGFAHIHAREEKHWPKLVELMGHPAWTKDSRFADPVARDQNFEALWEHLEEWSCQHTKEEVSRWAQDRRMACAPVNDMAEVLQSAQLQERGFFQTIRHPVAGTVTLPGAPYKFDRELWGLYRPAPRLGEHNEEIYVRRLGTEPIDLARMRATGVI